MARQRGSANQANSRLYLVYLFIGRYILAYFSMLAFRMIGLRISAKIRYEYLTALFGLSVSALDTIPTGQTVSTITSTANILQLGISEKLGTLIQFSALMLTAIIIVSRARIARENQADVFYRLSPTPGP